VLQLREAVAESVWKNEAARIEFAPEPVAGTAYGIAAHLRHRLYGILRPSPASLHRLPATVSVLSATPARPRNSSTRGRSSPPEWCTSTYLIMNRCR